MSSHKSCTFAASCKSPIFHIQSASLSTRPTPLGTECFFRLSVLHKHRRLSVLPAERLDHEVPVSIIDSTSLCPLSMFVVATMNLYPENHGDLLQVSNSSTSQWTKWVTKFHKVSKHIPLNLPRNLKAVISVNVHPPRKNTITTLVEVGLDPSSANRKKKKNTIRSWLAAVDAINLTPDHGSSRWNVQRTFRWFWFLLPKGGARQELGDVFQTYQSFFAQHLHQKQFCLLSQIYAVKTQVVCGCNIRPTQAHTQSTPAR